MELYDLTIHEASGLLKGREIGARQLTQALLGRIERLEPKLNAYITPLMEEALKGAQRADEAIAKGSFSPLLGIPLGVKDNLCTKGIKTTCASKILYNFIPPFDATVIEKLNASGYIPLGKTNMDEFAMGSSTENSAFGPTKNPWDLERVPGGSSGGSAAAVAAGMCLGALGSDTGGSIRLPASFCGVVGLKPTYGRVSRYGLVAYASSLDQIGPIAKDVTDCAILAHAISGHDPKDSTSIDRPVEDYLSYLTGDAKGLIIGMPGEYFGEGIDLEVREAVILALKVLEGLGARVEEVSLPHTPYAIPAYYLIATAEASSNLARYDGVRYGFRVNSPDLLTLYERTRATGFGAEVKRRIMLGTYGLSAGYYDAYYGKAQRVRTLIKADFDKAFEVVDLIAIPTSPTTAFKIGEKIADPLTMYLSDICTISVNLAGLPAISIPCGFDKKGLPIGLQIIGRPFQEGLIFKASYAYEQATDWHKRRPKI